VPLGNNIFTFNAEGKGVDLTGLTNPVTVVLTIGTDSGTSDLRSAWVGAFFLFAAIAAAAD
jgi:hypothetical protein